MSSSQSQVLHKMLIKFDFGPDSLQSFFPDVKWPYGLIRKRDFSHPGNQLAYKWYMKLLEKDLLKK